jgi:hypothetical protein
MDPNEPVHIVVGTAAAAEPVLEADANIAQSSTTAASRSG